MCWNHYQWWPWKTKPIWEKKQSKETHDENRKLKEKNKKKKRPGRIHTIDQLLKLVIERERERPTIHKKKKKKKREMGKKAEGSTGKRVWERGLWVNLGVFFREKEMDVSEFLWDTFGILICKCSLSLSLCFCFTFSFCGLKLTFSAFSTLSWWLLSCLNSFFHFLSYIYIHTSNFIFILTTSDMFFFFFLFSFIHFVKSIKLCFFIYYLG